MHWQAAECSALVMNRSTAAPELAVDTHDIHTRTLVIIIIINLLPSVL